MVQLQVSLQGFDEFRRSIMHYINVEYPSELGSDMKSSLEALLDVIKEDYVPIRPTPEGGTLRDSGYVSDAEIGRDGVQLEIGFDADYAEVQHERLDFNHTHGQAKYLEQPLESWIAGYVRDSQR